MPLLVLVLPILARPEGGWVSILTALPGLALVWLVVTTAAFRHRERDMMLVSQPQAQVSPSSNQGGTRW
jgi:hypothetical protein